MCPAQSLPPAVAQEAHAPAGKAPAQPPAARPRVLVAALADGSGAQPPAAQLLFNNTVAQRRRVVVAERRRVVAAEMSCWKCDFEVPVLPTRYDCGRPVCNSDRYVYPWVWHGGIGGLVPAMRCTTVGKPSVV